MRASSSAFINTGQKQQQQQWEQAMSTSRGGLKTWIHGAVDDWAVLTRNYQGDAQP
ncbi:hypothetical protein METHB2_310007 [Candidatus Methylobacter favarea]|uniref:Uncharacterized protein n=1 Tax=Candidatus Methylobacter favarea TaxID=2707345 RepID=A0A8S0XIP6_9GAMM|nr:hypothetical protein [Candidatus Methylobacter favarea]CAA9890976.1 hypothetical protein METHB2_310007 [Candidatus Methylobacter favarea]